MRRLADGFARSSRRCRSDGRPRRRSSTRTRTGSPSCGGTSSAPRRARADARAERAAGDASCGSSAGDPPGEPTRHPRRATASTASTRGPRGRTDLAAEPRLAARRARGRHARRRAHARPLRGAGRQGDAARGRGRRGRAPRGPRPRAARRTCRRLGADNVTVVHADAHARCRPSSPASTARSSTRRAPASACSRGRPDLRWRARPLPELQLRAPARRRASACARAARSSTPSARSTPAENEDVVDASGPRASMPARRRVAAVPASAPAGVPAHAAARPRHHRVLHRPPT